MEPKVVVVTGASSGIGASTAEHLGRAGMSLVLAARRKAKLDEVAERSGRNVLAVVTDVAERAQVRALVARSIERFGHIDVWINNVGRGITRVPSELTDEDVNVIMQLNVLSALYGMQEVLPHFKARGTGQVINISSLLGRIPFATFRSSYSGAKHYLNALTAMFREEVQQTHPGIQFTLVSPGLVATDFGLSALHGGPDSRTLPSPQSVEEVAQVIADVIESRAPDVYTRKGSRDRIAGYYATVGVDP